tara:strand:- start:205 stop:477 length:273 start_codon:yes stop_codon:yes gene_type:complete
VIFPSLDYSQVEIAAGARPGSCINPSLLYVMEMECHPLNITGLSQKCRCAIFNHSYKLFFYKNDSWKKSCPRSLLILKKRKRITDDIRIG